MSDEGNPNRNLIRTSISNFQWSTLTIAVTSGAHFAISILLARMLEPSDFGIVAYAAVFVTLTSRITEFGIAPAIIQARTLNQYHLRVGFTLMVLLALACYAGLFAAAPLVASGIRLRVLRVAALSIVISSIGLIANSTLQRDLRFKDLFYISSFSSVCGYGMVSIALAFLGYGPWSIVLGNLAYLLLRNIVSYVISPHPVTPSIKRKEAAELLTYGFGMSLGTFANVVARGGHIFVVGRILGDTLLGIYQRAYTLITFPIMTCNTATTSVLFPTLAKVQDEQDRLRRGFLISLSLTSFILFPIMASLAICAPEVIIGLLTKKWQAAIPVTRLFCIFGIFSSIYPLGDALGRASGRVYQKSMIHIVYGVISVGLCYIAAFHGMMAVTGAMIVSVIITYTLMGVLVVRILKISFWRFLEAQLSGVCSALVVCGLCFPVTWAGRLLGMHEIVLLSMQMLVSIAGLGIALFYLPERLVGGLRRIICDYLARFVPDRFQHFVLERTNV